MEWVYVSEVMGNYEKRGRETETERQTETESKHIYCIQLENPLEFIFIFNRVVDYVYFGMIVASAISDIFSPMCFISMVFPLNS